MKSYKIISGIFVILVGLYLLISQFSEKLNERYGAIFLSLVVIGIGARELIQSKRYNQK